MFKAFLIITSLLFLSGVSGVGLAFYLTEPDMLIITLVSAILIGLIIVGLLLFKFYDRYIIIAKLAFKFLSALIGAIFDLVVFIKEEMQINTGGIGNLVGGVAQRHVIIDFESTGILNPRAVSIAWNVYEGRRPVHSRHYIVKSNRHKSSRKSLEIHGITESYAKKHGVPIEHIWEYLMSDLSHPNVTLASYNIEFDLRVLRREASVYGFSTNLIDAANHFCVMHACKPFLDKAFKRSGRYIKRAYKQTESYSYLVGPCPEREFHDAKTDVDMCSQLFFRVYGKV